MCSSCLHASQSAGTVYKRHSHALYRIFVTYTLEWDVVNNLQVESIYVVDAQVLLGIRQLIRVIFVYLFLACKQETLNLVRTVFLP